MEHKQAERRAAGKQAAIGGPIITLPPNIEPSTESWSSRHLDVVLCPEARAFLDELHAALAREQAAIPELGGRAVKRRSDAVQWLLIAGYRAVRSQK